MVSLVLLAETALLVESTGMAVAVGQPAAATESATAPAYGPAEAANEASAVLMARLQNRKVEVLSERVADSTTWALPSGSLQTEIFPGPIRVKRDGNWLPIDTALADAGAQLEPKAAVAEVALSDGGDTALASVSQGDATFGLGWAEKLPTPTIKGSTAAYDLGDGQTLKATALARGFSENITLADAPADAVSYRIPLQLDGLKLSQAASGHLLLKDEDGKLVAEAPAPMMWDASKNPASGESDHRAKVDTKIEAETDGNQTLVLTPDADFLSRTDLTYPVTVDPTSTLAATTDTWVQTPDYPDSQQGSAELKSGTYDTGTNKARSYVKFDVAKFAGKHITDTNLALYSFYSSTCATTGAGTEVRRITGSWDSAAITWGAQPATTATGAVVNKAALGYDSSCPGGTMNFDIDAIVAAWASGSANYGLRIAGADETDPYTWRRFRSANYISGDNSAEPHLTVTYNSYATNSALAVSPSQLNAYNGHRYVTSLTPTFSAKVTDADGGNAQAQFEVTSDPAYTDPTPVSYTALGKSVASGATSTLAVPSASAFPAGSHLRYRVRGYDGTDYGSWSGYSTFVLNTALPVAPTVSCPDYPASTWSAKAPGAVTCTLDTTSTDGQGFKWGLDDPAMAKRIDDTVNGTDGDPLTISITPGNGWHTLYAKTIDSGGNLSTATTSYAFGVGADGAALLSPGDGDRPARRVALAATGKPTYTGVTYQYRRGETDTWKNVPLADVSKNSDGSAITAWPLAAPNGAPAPLAWNITTSLVEDGPIDIRAAFTDGTTTGYSPTSTVTVDRNAGTAPSHSVGPGSVNDLTGDFALSATDAEAFGMSVSRTASSRQPTAGTDAKGQVAIFGPQWTSGTTVELTDSDWAYIRQTSATSVALVDADGVETGLTATNSGGWKAEPGAEELTLTGSLTGSFTLKDTQGTTTTFAKVDPAATTWQVSATSRPTSTSTTTVTSEKVISGSQTLARPKYIIAPTTAATAQTCQTTPSTKGCRMLEFVYATVTTATGSSTSAEFGDYTGQVKEIRLWSTAPAAASATSRAIATYRYDAGGKLRQQWNPDLAQATQTEYSYDAAGRVVGLRSQSQLPWTFTYGTAGNAATAGPGMLLAASRPTLERGSASQTDGGTATTSMVYGVPLTGTKAPYPMGISDVAAWGQTNAPTDATAVFPADAVPASHDGASLTAANYARASVSYADASGREVNSASPGGHIATTDYDYLGHPVRELTASNRELALATGGKGVEQLTLLGINNSSTAERAQQLSVIHVYSNDGVRELESFGPLHLTTLTSTLQAGTGGTSQPAGSELPAREHTVTAYDEGRPADGSASMANQPTTVTTGARVDGYPQDADIRVSKTGDDWVKGLPTSTTEDVGGLNNTRTTSYDSQGRVIKTTLPKSTGTDAGTTVTTYYSATGTGACSGRPEWADLVCSTGPAGAITGGGSNPTGLPTKTFEYDWWGKAVKTIEAANSVTRTTTSTTDNAGRPTRVSISGGVGTPVPDTITTYDENTSAVVTVTANGRTITHTTDMLGREIGYNDGAGNTTTTEYDSLDRPVKVADSAPSSTTYTYDTTKDPRGLETSHTDSIAGTFTASYNPDGYLAAEQLPGGYTLTVSRDETGQDTARTYTRDSDAAIVASDTADYSVYHQIVKDTSTGGQSYAHSYTYDQLGRLTQADDAAPSGSCTRRSYSFDANSNRVGLSTATSAVDAGCTSTGATETTSGYDSADRLIAPGIAYDAFGRTTTQSSGATVGYHANDLVRQQTTGTSRQTWSLDPAGRLASWTTETNNAGTWSQTGAKTNHYGSTSDNPDWISEDAAGSITRNVRGTSGTLAATTDSTDAVTLQLTDIHGDVTVQLPLDTTVAPIALAHDEFGNPESETVATRYGWLGSRQRSGETVTGAILMGVRLYDPSIGRFLSIDPVPGGNANAYAYPADPVNNYDLDGRKVIKKYNKNGLSCGIWSCTLKLSRKRTEMFIDILGGGVKAGGVAAAIASATGSTLKKAGEIGAVIWATSEFLSYYLEKLLKWWPNRGTKIVVTYYYGWSYAYHQ
ncbi:DNRLRE domain-containing protein [Streptomyces sp. NPDC058217]|uniref:DNRLRE domain-containing protein n=1 Tax=Streptomyces sp. NPDC058217 TaxID=3346384 RepID=UPI0036E5A8D8